MNIDKYIMNINKNISKPKEFAMINFTRAIEGKKYIFFKSPVVVG